MKKKILLIILCGVCLLGITGCGTSTEKNKSSDSETKTGVNGKKISDVKAEIINNDGKKEKKSWSELDELLEENNENFTKNYDGAKITITDTVDKITKDSLVSWPKTPGGEDFIGHTYEIELSSGWYVYIDQNNNDLSDVLKGTKVEISSYVHDNTYWPIIRGTFENNDQNQSIETTDSTIKIVD